MWRGYWQGVPYCSSLRTLDVHSDVASIDGTHAELDGSDVLQLELESLLDLDLDHAHAHDLVIHCLAVHHQNVQPHQHW